jgi:ABC-type bacteriocin/lantibiotic exporter with double-glycine peptidase domain
MDIPYYEQETEYTCGAASMRMVLDYFGIKKSESQIAKLLKTNKVRGTWLRYFPRVAEKYKLNYVVKRNASFADLRRLYKKNYAIIICYSPGRTDTYTIDHYSVVRSIDMKNIHLFDPYDGPKTSYSLKYFKKIWLCDPKHEDEKRWLFAIKR